MLTFLPCQLQNIQECWVQSYCQRVQNDNLASQKTHRSRASLGDTEGDVPDACRVNVKDTWPVSVS